MLRGNVELHRRLQKLILLYWNRWDLSITEAGIFLLVVEIIRMM